jgi:hypothetical protein
MKQTISLIWSSSSENRGGAKRSCARTVIRCATAFTLLSSAVVVGAPGLENLALGKPYTLEPSPNYAHCTEPGDATQLTDGQYTGGYFWTEKPTVGWSGIEPIIVTIDLGRVHPISGASWSTAAGVAGVEWPRAISVLVSDDGRSYFDAGDLVALSNSIKPPPQEGYAVHRFVSDQLKAHGRFVKFLVVPSGAYCFVDEIEVFKGDPFWVNLASSGEPITDAKAHFHAAAALRSVQRRIRNDSRALREAIDLTQVPAESKRSIAALLDPVESELAALSPELPRDFRCVLPLNPLHESVFAAQAALWRAQHAEPITIWTCGPWDPLPLIGSLPGGRGRGPVSLKITMMQNEYRATAFNLSSAGHDSSIAHLRFEGFPDKPKPGWLTVHEVAWTDTRDGKPVAAALPLAASDAEGFRIKLLPGLTRQVWLTVHSANLPPGVHHGKILVSTKHQKLKVPFTVEVCPVRFPELPTLHLGGWDYTDAESHYDITPQNRAAVITHLREHFVDSPWATAAVLPFGQQDADGHFIAIPDTISFDRWIERWRGARQYCVFAAVGGEVGDSLMGTPAFEKKVAAWVRFWSEHARRRGLKPEQLAVLLVDEPTEAKQDAIILTWAKAIRAADSGVRVWEDPCHSDPAAADQGMMQACHVLCPNRPTFLHADTAFRDYYVQAVQRGAELAFYSCIGPVRSLDPYSYHRLQAWSCWQYRAKGSYFWAFGDAGRGSSWNEYATGGAGYVPFFLDAASVTSGKHMEAIREGMEDFEYLCMLEQRIAALEKAGRKGRALDRAKALLKEAPGRVCEASGVKQMNWTEGKNRNLADSVRVEVLKSLRAIR